MGTYHIDEIELATDIKNKVRALAPEAMEYSEMSNYDTAFICGLLRAFRPQKIVELGVSSGGTTAIMLCCLQEMGYEYRMYSIDTLEYAYKYPDKAVGFVATDVKSKLGVETHELIGGRSFPMCAEVIGGDIDFLVLDTTHSLPGEVLEFLAVYPFLKEGAVVCMHDLRFNLSGSRHAQSAATNALFNSVVAEKYIGEDQKRSFGYPNIGAFIVGPETDAYITNVFGVLTQTWHRVPSEDDLAPYTQIIERSYGDEAQWIYRRAIELNREFDAIRQKGRVSESVRSSLPVRAARKLKRLLTSR